MTDHEIQTVHTQYKERIKNTHRNYVISICTTIIIAAVLIFKLLMHIGNPDVSGQSEIVGIAGIIIVFLAAVILIMCFDRAAGLKYTLYVQETIKADQNFYVEEIDVDQVSYVQLCIDKNGNQTKIEKNRYYVLFCYIEKAIRIYCEIDKEIYVKLNTIVEEKANKKMILSPEPFKNSPIILMRWYEDSPK